MATSHWHKLYGSTVAAPPAILFELLSDLPNYARWLPASAHFAETTDVEPYPVRLGSRYHDGKPGEPGKDWWGAVTGFQPPGSLDFHHTIQVSRLKATIGAHIHYSLEPEDRSFDEENMRTMTAVKDRDETQVGSPTAARASSFSR